MEKKGYLLLADGQLYEGIFRGEAKNVTAELVFTTALTGGMEMLTDAGCAGQIVVQTFPAAGGSGVIPEDFQGDKPHIAGFVVRAVCDTPSNFRCQGRIDDFLKENGIPCLTGVDTRALTRHIRNHGAMNAALLTEKPDDIVAAAAALREIQVQPAMQDVSCAEIVPAKGEGKYNVVLWDFGAKNAVQSMLEKRGCAVTRVPADTSAEVIAALKPDGVLLSGGPGNPDDNAAIIEQIRCLCRSRVPMFGIGLGHQLLALSQGAQCIRLNCGHHGANQPAKDVKTGMSYMTSQAHLYAVNSETLPANASLRFVSGNDGTCEGIDYMDMPAFSVQFHPEAAGGPLDTRYLFDRFIALMGGNKECR